MKTLYLDCSMGASGDMLTAALLELMPDPDAFIDRLNSIGIPGVVYSRVPSRKCGITGTHINVYVNGETEDAGLHHHHAEHDTDEHSDAHAAHEHEHHHHSEEHEHHHHSDEHEHHHSHTSLKDIEHLVREHLDLPEKVKRDVLSVYQLIAEAESHVHGTDITQIHFHEVGTMDAVADVTAVSLLIDALKPDEIVASPVHVGAGQCRCGHGILPVPAPATAYILRDVPIYGGSIKSELCTPTGAALLKHFVDRFGDMPVMNVHSAGYGMGNKDFEAANCVRSLWSETGDKGDTVCELVCSMDDITGEALGFASERLFEAGALEVYTVPIQMKKSRPGVELKVFCREADRDRIVSLILMHTTTLGIRESISRRYTLTRHIETLNTPYGEIRQKVSTGYGVKRTKLEFEDLARAARESGKSLDDIRHELETV